MQKGIKKKNNNINKKNNNKGLHQKLIITNEGF